jgi:hypothetical protein
VRLEVFLGDDASSVRLMDAVFQDRFFLAATENRAQPDSNGRLGNSILWFGGRGLSGSVQPQCMGHAVEPLPEFFAAARPGCGGYNVFTLGCDMDAPTDTKKTSANSVSQIVGFTFRYGCAIVVAFLVSAFIMLVGSIVFGVGVVPFLAGSNLFVSFVVGYAAALAGVLLGSLCLGHHDRRLASVALLILGLGYYLAWYDGWKSQAPWIYGGRIASHPLLLPLVLGAASAVLATVFAHRRRGNQVASPNGGPAAQAGDSGATEGPPSVS